MDALVQIVAQTLAVGGASAAVLLATAWTLRRFDVRRDARRTAYRAWCARVGWCPDHHRPDGQCPPVQRVGSNGKRWLADCSGSALLR